MLRISKMREINFRWSLFQIVNNKQSPEVCVFIIRCGKEKKRMGCVGQKKVPTSLEQPKLLLET